MKLMKWFSIFVLSLSISSAYSQTTQVDHALIQEDLDLVIRNLSQYYVYLEEKNVDLGCIREHYEKQIQMIKTEEQSVLFFEYLLDEFYDSHLILNTNRQSSFRLFSPVYASIVNGKPVITSVWLTQISNLDQNLIGAELLRINGVELNQAIEQFPTHCSDKNTQEIREWTINKILAGRYNQPRVLQLKLANQKIMELDLDQLQITNPTGLLTSQTIDGIGVIRINNSLGNNYLVTEFDKVLDNMMDTEGLIIDLRNTVGGGNSYVARGIMSRLINRDLPYQRHVIFDESWDNQPKIGRSWAEYASPRGKQYDQPVVVLVGRWTGSMGEGLAIGLEGMERAQIVGTEMERLAGEMNGFPFKNRKFDHRLSVARLFHMNGTPREKYIPTNYVVQTTLEKDEAMEKGIELIKQLKE